MRFFAIASVLFAAAASVFANPIAERSNPPSAAVVLSELSATIVPLVEQLTFCTAENATEAILTPILNDITSAVNTAITGLDALVGQTLDVILVSVDGTVILTVTELANIVCDIVIPLLQAVGIVLALVNSAIYSVIFDLSVTLGQAVCGLINILVTLLADIAVILLVLLVPVASVIDLLGLGSLLAGILGGIL